MAKAAQDTTETTDVYARLAAPFDHTFKDIRGGVELEYATGEQVISRLNEVLGFGGWTFEVMEHGWREDADEYWVLGKLVAFTVAQTEAGPKPVTITRMQFGSQKVKRSRTNGNPLDIGFDLKGATTDALKKCASLIGVGLYLSKKDEQVPRERANDAAPTVPRDAAPMQQGVQNGAVAVGPQSLLCDVCQEPLAPVTFKDGTTWTPRDLAGHGNRKHKMTLCMTHYREAKASAERNAEATF